MRMQACSCVCMILPRNPNPSFFYFVSYFTCNASVLDPFSRIHGFEVIVHSHEYGSLNMILFNDRLEHVCLEELSLITCLLESFYACVSTLI